MSWRHLTPEARTACYERRSATIRRKAEAEFWTKTDRTSPNGCWVWTGARQTPRAGGVGYGYMVRFGKQVYAHRHALELKLGRPLGPGMQACHHCDNPPCINPDHLCEGTNADNVADRAVKHPRPTTCRRGHALDEANAYAFGNRLQCRTCARNRRRAKAAAA